jgi:hypothetical protein
MAKYIIGAIFLILIIGGGYYFFSGTSTSTPPAMTNQQPVVPTTETYASSTFSITHPVGWATDANYAYTGVSAAKPIHGVKFTIPLEMATGTNLSSDSGVSVEILPRATSCTGDIFVLDNVKPTPLNTAGKTFSVATTSGAGAGNRYDEMVFAVTDSKPCTAVRYFIHSTAIGNYPEGTVREFDRDALLRAFDTIRDSLTIGSAAAQPSTSLPSPTPSPTPTQ